MTVTSPSTCSGVGLSGPRQLSQFIPGPNVKREVAHPRGQPLKRACYGGSAQVRQRTVRALLHFQTPRHQGTAREPSAPSDRTVRGRVLSVPPVLNTCLIEGGIKHL